MMNKRVGKPSHLLILSPCCFHPAKFLLVLSSLITEEKKIVSFSPFARYAQREYGRTARGCSNGKHL